MSLDTYALAALVDRLLEIAGDDPCRLATLLDELDDRDREEVLVSDFVNALQVFVYYFRQEPTILGAERLILHAGSDAVRGIVFEERDIYELFFRVDKTMPVIEIRAGDETVCRFEGESAYRGAIASIDDLP